MDQSSFPARILIHIGHHKTGTTWLQQVLFTKEHGFCLLNNVREPWKDGVLRALVMGEGYDPARVREWVQERWDGKRIPVISAERLSGHPASGGFDQEHIAARLHQTFPEALIVIGTREADEVKVSVYKQLVREGFLGKNLSAHETTDWKVPQIREDYFQHVLLVRHYRSLFAAEQVVEFHYAALHRDPQVWVETLEKAWGSPLNIELSNRHRRRLNASWSDRRIRVERVANYFKKSALNPYPLVRLNKRLARWVGEIAVLFGA